MCPQCLSPLKLSTPPAVEGTEEDQQTADDEALEAAVELVAEMELTAEQLRVRAAAFSLLACIPWHASCMHYEL